ncbi:dihydropteroate synthase [Nitriliruptor alkaliphilus]|uniref:dihydropteroate synthase n=1 Tax=Nitriliruptor alkaliphilus TaxID=427918 RepID=UPI000A54637D|nr:dihydropteroate synthase [Nitriliruptor alkaliphilus]
MADDRPICRVEDARLVPDGGPARLVLTGLDRAAEIADKVAAARGVGRADGDRLEVMAVPSRLTDAAGRVGGADLAVPLGEVVEAAVAAWLAGSPDLVTPAGTLPTGSRPVVLGVLNVTPDSFSDGGTAFGPADHPAAAIRAGEALLAAGADAIDIGGESTRPGADPVPLDEELRRVLPVVEALAATGAVVAIDTVKGAVARAAVEAGASIVNDVSGGSLDPDMREAVLDLGVPYVLTHLLGEPRTMQRDPRYDDVVTEVFDHLAAGVRGLVADGLPADHIVVDPGLGFGKTARHNLALLRATRDLTSLGRPVLIGASRKSFLGTLTGVDDPAQRIEGSLAAAAVAVTGGARIIRAHDVQATVRAVRVAHAVAQSQDA